MKKKHLNKIISVIMALTIVISVVQVKSVYAECVNSTDEDIQQYIIKTDTKRAYDKISTEYEDIIIEDSITYNLRDENIIVVQTTENEINEISAESGVVVIEKDVIVTASSENELINNSESSYVDRQWNLDVINADNDEYKIANADIKVAILDSGVTATSLLNVEKSINLIPGEENVHPLYEDGSGHGTAVASVIAAQYIDEGIIGVNPNAKIYSVKILDDNKISSASRVAEGIYWCIDNDVDIINMSFGTTEDCEILHKAISDAAEKGILMIAAAGNNGTVEYPAAYDEVIAVGSVGTSCEKSYTSAKGQELELSAPGELIPAIDTFNDIIFTAGTSMAAAQVSGVASVLWSKDNSKDATFIRNLLNKSANNVGKKEEYGNGIVDLGYALSIYNEFNDKYAQSEDKIDIHIPENPYSITKYDDSIVKASWWTNKHSEPIQSYSDLDETARTIMVRGAKYPDIERYNMNVPELNGIKNFVANYIYLIKIARKCYTSGINEALKVAYPINIEIDSVAREAYNNIQTYMNKLNNDWGRNEVLGNYAKTNENKGRFLMGIAMHSAMDAYAHQSYDASFGMLYNSSDRDNPDIDKIRWNVAKEVGKQIITEWKSSHNFSALQFKVNDTIHVKGQLYLQRFAERVEKSDLLAWRTYATWFQARSYTA